MEGFAVYYVEANIVCALIFGILLIHNHFNIDRQEKQIKFDHVLVAFILYFLVDSIWAEMIAGIIPKTRPMAVSVDFAIYLLMAATMYSWLEYVMAYEQAPHRNRPINKFAVIFPFLVSTIAMILHYIIAPEMLIDANLDSTNAFSLYLVTVPYIYMVAILFYTIRRARREKSRAEKRKHLFIGFFPWLVIAGGFVQMVFYPYIPIYCFTCVVLMLLFYIQSIELRISMDPLTQLNNRGQLTRYISSESNLHMEGRQTVVVMMDIDGFKGINDTFGHAEGDRALVIVSDALKKVVNSHSAPSFLGRYGGDEFILISHPINEAEVAPMIGEVRDEIARMVGDAPYPLSISAGYDALMGREDSIDSCIKRADKKLYLDKEYRKLNGRKAG